MKNQLMGLFGLLWISAASAQSNQPQTYAVVVGIAGYENPAIKGLEYANKDAQFFADWVGSAQGGKVPKENLRVLLNEQATVAAIYNALEWLKENCQAGDQAYIYFSGHGDIETRDNKSKGYLLAYNTPPNNYPNNAISVDQLNADANYLTLQKKTKVCIITDACHSGKLAGDFFKGKQWVAEQLQQVMNSEVRMAACAADQLAAEGEFWDGGRGVFSYHLLRGLYGLADQNKDGQVRFEELQQYLKTAFENDAYLKVLQQKQTPITDGNPLLVLSQTDTAFLRQKVIQNKTDTDRQSPIDHFFEFAIDYPLESIMAFDSLPAEAMQNLPLYVVKKCLQQDSIDNQRDDIQGNTILDWSTHREQLKELYQQLKSKKNISKNFQERFVELVQTKAQAMINAYLNGEEAELEKRQYYYSGTRQYSKFLPMVKWALQTVPPRHNLARVLEVDFHYLSGVVARLNMALSPQTDSLVKLAFQHQYRTQELEPYAAYVENELANLYVHLKKFDSAQYHFDLATTLATTWAIPWSNQIRMNLMTNDLPKANKALQMADSLQPNLSYVYMNAGLLKEREKKHLEAISYYRRAIHQNAVHFLPHERLAYLYLQNGDYRQANTYFTQAEGLKKNFSINESYFKFGVELGGENRFGEDEAPDSCWQNSLSGLRQEAPMTKLLRALGMPRQTSSDAVRLLFQAAIEANPQAPLAHHYLGKFYLQEGKYALAIPVLKEAIRWYAPDSLLYKTFSQAFFTPPSPACLWGLIRARQYDQREDYYLLAKALEAENRIAEALTVYEQASAMENQILLDQASYKDFEAVRSRLVAKYKERPTADDVPAPVFKNKKNNAPKPKVTEDPVLYFMPEFFDRYEVPVKLTSVVQRMRLHEKLNQYEKAEKVLLDQVQLSRKAGYAREATFATNLVKKMKPFDKTNNFWVNANRELEITVHDFYLRRMRQEPRNFYWQQQAALFLYHRLRLAYEQMPQEFYVSFTTDMENHAYPWQLDDAGYDTQEAHWPTPGLPDTLVVALPAFQPVASALSFAEKALALSPSLAPGFEVNQMLADLNNWMGNDLGANTYFQQGLLLKPQDQVLRKKYANMLLLAGNHAAAFYQLDTLQRYRKPTTEEGLQLAFFELVQGQYAQAQKQLQAMTPKDPLQQMQKAIQQAQLFYQQGNHSAAAKVLLQQFPSITSTMANSADSTEIQEWNSVRFYLLARNSVLQNNPSQALAYLKKSQEKNYNLCQVIMHDPIWEKWRKGTEKKWFQFIASKATESPDAFSFLPDIFVTSIAYYIPGQSKYAEYLTDLYKSLGIK